jgi:hypothetical protein
MSLLPLQSFLSRLYTDRSFREAFRSDRAATIEASGVPGDDRELLFGLDLAQVERYAAGLRSKRIGYLRERLPIVAAVGRERFTGWAERFLEAQPSADEGRRDAIRFLRFLTERAAHDASLHRPAYLPDLLRFEQIRLELLLAAATEGVPDATAATRDPDERLRLAPTSRVVGFRFDFCRLYPRLVAGQLHPVRPEPCWLLFGLAGGREIRWRRIDPRMAQLLEYCDGETSAEQVLDRFDALGGAPVGSISREEARGALAELLRVGIVVGQPAQHLTCL